MRQLLVVLYNAAVVVARFAVRFERNTFEVRKLLEGHAAGKAASYMDDNQLEALRRCVEIGHNGTVEEIMEANREFHELIMRASNNALMMDLFDRMTSVIYLFRQTVVQHQRPFLIDEHEAIYGAIKARDGAKAEQLMKDHLQADLEFCLHLIR